MPDMPDRNGPGHDDGRDLERRRKRAVFLRELHEAKALRERVQPRRARANRMRQQMRMRTFRW
jgi:16S rRNA G527 N7-methylase RsmG